MIFRNSDDYAPIEADTELENLITDVKDFAATLIPQSWTSKLEHAHENLTIMFTDKNGNYKSMWNGILKDKSLPGSVAARTVWTNTDMKSFTGDTGIAVRSTSSSHLIAHETLHAFSGEMFQTEDDFVFKMGASYTIFNKSSKSWSEKGKDLNESITDALASRFLGKIGPDPRGAGYAEQDIVADLLMGENIKDNLFLQDVYWGDGTEFAKDFDKTIKMSGAKFDMFLDGFTVLGNAEDNKKSDELLKGAVEYNLRKAKTAEEIDKVYQFQKKVIDFYKNGGIGTGFMEDNDINRLEQLEIFADKAQKQCKSNLTAQKLMAQKHINNPDKIG